MNKIKFVPDNIEAECAPNENIFQLSDRIGVYISNTCGGIGSCGECKVKITEGMDCLNALTTIEKKHLGNVSFITKERLACQCKFINSGDATIEVLNE